MLLARLFYLIGLCCLGLYYLKLGHYPVYDWLGFLAVLSAFCFYSLHRKLPHFNQYVLLSGGLLILGAIVTIQKVPDPYNSTFSAILMLYTLVLWISLPSLLFVEWKHLHAAFIALGISVLVTSGYAIYQKSFGLPNLGESYYWGRMIGLTRHPNELGTFCAKVFPCLLCLSMISGKVRDRLIWIGVSLIAVLGVLLSGSMTGALSLAAGTLGYYALTSRKGRLRTAVLIIAFAVVALGITSMYGGKYTQLVTQRLERFIVSDQGRFTLNQRIAGYLSAWQYIKSNPIQGQGYHADVIAIESYMQVHNAFLRSWFNGGIFTLLSVLVLLSGAAIALYDSWRCIRWTDNISHKSYVAAVTGAFVAVLVTMLSSPTLYQRSSWFPVALAFAVNIIVRRKFRACR